MMQLKTELLWIVENQGIRGWDWETVVVPNVRLHYREPQK